MFFVDLFVAFGVAAVFTVVAVLFLKWRYPGRSDLGLAMLFLFSVLFMTVWAGGTWMGSGSLITFILLGAGVLLLVAVLTSPRHPRGQDKGEVVEASRDATLFGTFFWVLMISLFLAVLARYVL